MRARIVLLAFVVLWVAGPVRADIGLPSIKNKLIELALEQISSPGSFEVTAGSIDEEEDGVTRLNDVKVSDGVGAWLTLDQLRFAWQPDRLLSGELAITRLELIGLTVARPPSESAEAPQLKPTEPSDRGLFDWPRSPLSLSIEGVRLERVTIAEGVLPQEIRFDAEGRAVDKGDLQELALSLRRTDAVDGQIAVAMRRDFAANTVKLAINANEAPGGMVAAAAGFPADVPARLDVRAEGPPEDWRLIFEATVERVLHAQGRATLAYADRLAVSADLRVSPGPELASELRTVLGDRASLRAEMIERQKGMLEVRSGSLVSPALTLNASGAFATAAGHSDLAVSLAALPPLAALVDGVSFDRLNFDGRVIGPRDRLAAVGELHLNGLATAALDARKLALAGRVAQTATGLDFELDGSGAAMRLDKLGSDILGAPTLAAAGSLNGDKLTLANVALTAPALKLTATGSYDLAGGSGNVSAHLAVPEIAPLASAYGVSVRGGVVADTRVAVAGDAVDAKITTKLTGLAMDRIAAGAMTLRGTVRQDAKQLAFDLSGDGQQVVLDRIPGDLTRDLSLAGRGQVVSGTLRLKKLTLTSPLLAAKASGTLGLEEGPLALSYQVTTTDLKPVAGAYGADASGVLEAEGRITGTIDAPRIDGRAGIDQAGFGGRSLGAVALDHRVALGDRPAGHVRLTARGSALGEASAETRFQLDGATLSLRELRAGALGAGLEGSAGIDLDRLLVDGAVNLEIADLGPAGRFAGIDLGGAATGRIAFQPAGGQQSVSGKLAVTGLTSDGTSLDRADLLLKADQAFTAPHLDVRLTAAGIEAGDVALDAFQAKAIGPVERIEFSANTDGTFAGQRLTGRLAGWLDADSAPTGLTLEEARVTAGADTANLRQPLLLRLGDGTVSATGLDLALPESASLKGDAAMRPDGMTGDLSLSRLPLDLAQRWAGAPVTAGRLDLRAVFDTRQAQAGAKLNAQARGLRFDRSVAGGDGFDLDFDAGWDGRRADVKAELRGGFGEPLRANLAAPLLPGADGLPVLPQDGEIDGALVWSGDLGDLWALVPAPGHILDGRADLDLSLAGRLSAPHLSGRADLSDGEYQNLDAGTILHDLKVRTKIADDGGVTVVLQAGDGGDGTVEADVSLRLADAAPSLDGAATIRAATLVRRDDVTARISGDLALAGPLAGLALTGQVTIDKAEVRLVNATPPEVVELEGVRIQGAPEPEATEAEGGAVALDLTVRADRNIFVRGRGLESEWKMDLAIAGDSAAPAISGTIEKVRGRLDLLGRPFDLDRGRVVFDGGQAIDPLLDLSLQYEDHGIRGGILLSGRASAPDLRFASVPALPEDEVLPRLLFGRSKQSLSGPEALQLATGVATLLSGEAGILDSVRDAAGVDVLRVEGESVEAATVTVGRNVGEGIFVGARQKLGGAGSALAVEVEIMDGVVVDTEVGQSGGSNSGISLRYDF